MSSSQIRSSVELNLAVVTLNDSLSH